MAVEKVKKVVVKKYFCQHTHRNRKKLVVIEVPKEPVK